MRIILYYYYNILVGMYIISNKKKFIDKLIFWWLCWVNFLLLENRRIFNRKNKTFATYALYYGYIWNNLVSAKKDLTTDSIIAFHMHFVFILFFSEAFFTTTRSLIRKDSLDSWMVLCIMCPSTFLPSVYVKMVKMSHSVINLNIKPFFEWIILHKVKRKDTSRAEQ